MRSRRCFGADRVAHAADALRITDKVYDSINLWLKKDTETCDKYASQDSYVKHAIYSASVHKPKVLETEIIDENSTFPFGARLVFKREISRRALECAYQCPQQRTNGTGDAMRMILRLQDGKIIDP